MAARDDEPELVSLRGTALEPELWEDCTPSGAGQAPEVGAAAERVVASAMDVHSTQHSDPAQQAGPSSLADCRLAASCLSQQLEEQHRALLLLLAKRAAASPKEGAPAAPAAEQRPPEPAAAPSTVARAASGTPYSGSSAPAPTGAFPGSLLRTISAPVGYCSSGGNATDLLLLPATNPLYEEAKPSLIQQLEAAHQQQLQVRGWWARGNARAGGAGTVAFGPGTASVSPSRPECVPSCRSVPGHSLLALVLPGAGAVGATLRRAGGG